MSYEYNLPNFIHAVITIRKTKKDFMHWMGIIKTQQNFIILRLMWVGNGCIYTHIGEAAIGWVYIQIEMQRERSRCEWEKDRGNEMHEIRQAEGEMERVCEWGYEGHSDIVK